jgi:hypothetical protein
MRCLPSGSEIGEAHADELVAGKASGTSLMLKI